MKEHERRERLKNMSEEDRKKEEQHYEEMKKKHADHPKVNHPVRHLQFVWLKRHLSNYVEEWFQLFGKHIVIINGRKDKSWTELFGDRNEDELTPALVCVFVGQWRPT